MIRVLLADDQKLFVESLRRVIETVDPTISIIGVAENGEEAVGMALEMQPDIAILDVRMPIMDGVHAAQAIKEQAPETKLIMLTTFDDDQYVFEALAKGAVGYLLKDIEPEKLVDAIHAVASGAVLMAGTVASKVFTQMVSPGAGKPIPIKAAMIERPTWYHTLSYREREVAALLAKGLDNHEIASVMFLAEQTVKNHISAIYTKLCVKDRLKLVEKLRPLLDRPASASTEISTKIGT